MYHRILVKLSGQALAGNSNSGILDPEALLNIGKVIKQLVDQGSQIGIVVGAGNICRGSEVEKLGIDRIVGDHMGMLGTEINSFAILDALQKNKQKAVVLSSISLGDFAELFSEDLAEKYFKEGYVCIFGGGTGKPFFSTDTCATMRALEINADAIFIAKHGVDGIYSDDPRTNKNAVMFKEIKCSEIIARDLKVMDLSAIKMIMDKDIDIRVFNMQNPDNFLKVARKEDIGTTIKRG